MSVYTRARARVYVYEKAGNFSSHDRHIMPHLVINKMSAPFYGRKKKKSVYNSVQNGTETFEIHGTDFHSDQQERDL